MKKLLLGILFLPAVCFGIEGPQIGGQVSKGAALKAGQYVSQGVYQSSQTCAGSTLQSVWISSPAPAILHTINVSSPGSGGAFVEVWDGAPSTATNQARRVSYINSALLLDQTYDVSFSSWLGVSNQAGVGGNPACLDIIYRVR